MPAEGGVREQKEQCEQWRSDIADMARGAIVVTAPLQVGNRIERDSAKRRGECSAPVAR